MLSVVTIISILGQESKKLRGLLGERKMRMNRRGIQEEQGGGARSQSDLRVLTTPLVSCLGKEGFIYSGTESHLGSSERNGIRDSLFYSRLTQLVMLL